MKSFLQLREASNRTKRNPTRDFLRNYPVSDAEMAKPVKKPEKKKPEQGVAEATVNIADIKKKENISPKDKKTLGKIHDLMARERALQQAKLSKTTKAVKEERESVFKSEIDEAGPFSYGAKPPRKGSVAYNALMKRKEQDRKRVKEIEAIGTKNHHVSVAKVTKEEIEDVIEAKDEMYKYIDQSGGHQIKGKSGTYVGYTHSATKGKGANILKHNTTKKYYAAGGSSTAFTQKTTLHDTPEDAARAYHKGNLAEASPMIKPPKNEFGKKEDAFAHAKKHGGKVMKKTFTHPTSGMQTVSYVVKEDINNEAYMGKIKPQKSPQQKFKDSMKRAGYDMDAGAKRLQDLLAKHKKEREELESKYKD